MNAVGPAWWLNGLLVLVLAAGCSDGDRSVDGQPDRLARKYLPFEAGWIPESEIPAEPQASPQMVIWEVSEFDPRIPATPDQVSAGADFVKRCFDAAVANNWFHRPKAMADGFLTKANDKLHYRKDAYTLDDIQLDPERPEYLMFYPDPDAPGSHALMGFMFLADGPEARGHQFAGPRAIWHYHVYTRPLCWAQVLLSMGPADTWGKCPEGAVPRHRSPEMVHVWFIDHPNGRFSSGMTLPVDTLRKGLSGRRETHGF